MKGLILAAGRSQRMQDLSRTRNKVLLDLGGGKTILDNLLDCYQAAGITSTYVTVGFDAASVKRKCQKRATPLLNPFFEHFGVLSSLWMAKPELYATSFLASVGDHYIEQDAVVDFKRNSADAPILLQVEMKKCDDEDMKVFLDARHELQTISKVWRKDAGTVLGEFTGMVRFTPAGSRLFFDALAEFSSTKPIGHDAFFADVLMACHKQQPLGFYVSSDHRRMDVDYPGDYSRACELYATRPVPTRVIEKEQPKVPLETDFSAEPAPDGAGEDVLSADVKVMAEDEASADDKVSPVDNDAADPNLGDADSSRTVYVA